jgi:hypothetical protein
MSKRKYMCKRCNGTGIAPPDEYSSVRRHCWRCDSEGVDTSAMFTDDYSNARYLANADTDSEPLAISNIRVWRENHANSEGVLWRVKHGGYGSIWIELHVAFSKRSGWKKEKNMKRMAKVARRMSDIASQPSHNGSERSGFDDIADICDDLCRLENYPVLDEDDTNEAEHEEEREHWDSYARRDFERAIERELENKYPEHDETSSAVDRWLDQIDIDMPEATKDRPAIDELYWQISSNEGEYPERIDSSAYEFHIEEFARIATSLAMMKPHGCQTLAEFYAAGEPITPDVAVLIDAALEQGELTSITNTEDNHE